MNLWGKYDGLVRKYSKCFKESKNLFWPLLITKASSYKRKYILDNLVPYYIEADKAKTVLS